MLQKLYAINLLKLLSKLSVFVIALEFCALTTSHATEENNKENTPKNFTNKFCSNITTKFSSKNDRENLNFHEIGKKVGKNEEHFLIPEIFPEIFLIILRNVEQCTLIKADTVSHSFKKYGDQIWTTKLLDLSRKLETPSQKGFDRVKTFAALERGRYKNVSLQYCGLGDMDESFSFKYCTTLDLSHNYIKDISNVCFPEALEYLQELNLSHNSLKGLEKFFNGYSAPALKKLNLSYNGLSQEAVIKLRNASKKPEILILEPQIEAPHYGPGTYGGTIAFPAWGIKRY